MTELTMSEVLKDPLIRLLLRADKISMGEFAQILEAAASRRNRDLSKLGPADRKRVAAQTNANFNSTQSTASYLSSARC